MVVSFSGSFSGSGVSSFFFRRICSWKIFFRSFFTVSSESSRVLLCRFWRRCSCCSCSSSSSWRIRASSKRLCLCCAAFLYIHLLHLRIISNMDFWVISTREIIMDTPAITYVPTVPKACTHSLQRMPPTRPPPVLYSADTS